MWMTRLALNRPVTIMVFVVAILVLGYYALGRMQVELQPKVDFPVHHHRHGRTLAPRPKRWRPSSPSR
jgi:hypothetical protein